MCVTLKPPTNRGDFKTLQRPLVDPSKHYHTHDQLSGRTRTSVCAHVAANQAVMGWSLMLNTCRLHSVHQGETGV